MVLLMDIIDASCTIPWIFLLTPPTPHPRALRWHVQYMWSTCEVRTRAERRLHATAGDPLSEKPGLKVTQVQRHFSAKKSSTTQLLLASTGHILVDEQEPSKGGSARRRKKLIEILRIFGNPIWSPYLLVSHLNTERNIRSESISMLWVSQDFWRGAYDRFKANG